MRKALFVAVPVLLIALVAYAYESPLGVLTSSGSTVNQTTTAVPFTLPAGVPLTIQCDAAACVRAGVGSSTAVTCTTGSANTGVLLAAGNLYDLPLAGPTTATTADTVAAISVSGTANCQVFKVITP